MWDASLAKMRWGRIFLSGSLIIIRIIKEHYRQPLTGILL